MHPILQMSVRALRKPASWLLLIVAMITALALYRDAFGYPLYHDDITYVRAVEGLTIPELFTVKRELPYYRPVGNLPWLLDYQLMGRVEPSFAHGYAVVMLGLCGWLAGLAARKLTPDRPIIIWGSLLGLVVYPFTYQPVTWSSCIGHIHIIAGTLGAILLFEAWWDSRRWPYLAGGWLSIFLASFSHENGAIVPALVAGWMLIVRLKLDIQAILAEWKRLAIAFIPAFAIGGAYALTWIELGRAQHIRPQVFLSGIGWNAVFLMQGLAHPVTLIGGPLVRAGAPQIPATLALDLAGIGLLGALLWKRGDRRLWITGWWYGIGILTAMLFLGNDYVVDGPRLMTVASFGAALGWSAAVDWLWQRLSGAWRLAPAALAALILVSGAWFVLSRMENQTKLSEAYHGIFDILEPDSQTLVANLPVWIAPQEQVYAMGTEGSAFLSPYSPFQELVRVNTGYTGRVRPANWPEIAPELPGLLVGFANDDRPVDAAGRLAAIRRNRQVLIVRAIGDHFIVEDHRVVPSIPGDAARFDNGYRLGAEAGYDADTRRMTLTLAWEAPQPEAVTPFVHVYCGDQVVAQGDGAPLAGMYPFTEWAAGERWQETRQIGLPEGVSLECLRVRIGLYHPGSGDRVGVGGEDAVDAWVR